MLRPPDRGTAAPTRLRCLYDLSGMVKAMNEELLVEEISHQEALLKIQRRNLRALELQIAQYGPFDVPLHMQGAQDDLRAEVARIERTLRDLRARLRRLKQKHEH